MHYNHPQRIASRCGHDIHPSSCAYTPLCPQCTNSLAKRDLEKARKHLEEEGGTDPATYMRDRAWNRARLQYAVTNQRVEKKMKKDQLRQRREEDWEEAHQRHLAQYGLFPRGPSTNSACQLCAAKTQPQQLHVKQGATSTVTWWERPSTLVANQVLVPNTPPRSLTGKRAAPKSKEKRRSYLRGCIQGYREMTSALDVQKRACEERFKTERVLRRKYGLTDDFEIAAKFFANPIPASHAHYHYRQIQDGQHSGARRANRYKRRAEGYRPARSSLAMSELARDVTTDNADLERMNLAAEDAELQRLARTVATEVGYLYFVGEANCSKEWRREIEQSNKSLVFRKDEWDVEMVELDQEQILREGGEGDGHEGL